MAGRSAGYYSIILVWVQKFSTQFDHWTKPDKNNTSYLFLLEWLVITLCSLVQIRFMRKERTTSYLLLLEYGTTILTSTTNAPSFENLCINKILSQAYYFENRNNGWRWIPWMQIVRNHEDLESSVGMDRDAYLCWKLSMLQRVIDAGAEEADNARIANAIDKSGSFWSWSLL